MQCDQKGIINIMNGLSEGIVLEFQPDFCHNECGVKFHFVQVIKEQHLQFQMTIKGGKLTEIYNF